MGFPRLQAREDVKNDQGIGVFGIGSTNFRYAALSERGAFLTEPAVEPTRPFDLETKLQAAVDSLGEQISEPLRGGGIVENGDLLRGEHAQSAEFGLIPLAPHADVESTGVPGAWEACCSGRGIPRFAASLLDSGRLNNVADTELATRIADGEVDAEEIFAAREDGDAFARACLDRVARINVAGISAICHTVNPGLITLGGGVALNNPEWIRAGIDKHLDEFLFVDRPEIRLTELGDDIGLYGALAAFLGHESAVPTPLYREPAE